MLLYVVWVILVLSVFAAAVGSQALFALDLSERRSGQLRAAYIARGALPYAAQALAGDETPTVDGLGEWWSNNAVRFQERPLGEGTFSLIGEESAGRATRYGLTDEERHLNLNTAPAAVLQRLLVAQAAVRASDAEAIAASIEDWRDTDDKERPLGAENAYYQTRHDPYACKDGPFENIEELLLVKGVTPTAYARVAPYLTVHGSGRLNLNTASPVALQALGLSEAGVSGLVSFRGGGDNLASSSDGQVLTSIAALESDLKGVLPVEDLAQLKRLAAEDVLGVRSEAFRAVIQAQTARASERMRVSCVIDRQGRVLSWSER